MKLHNDQNAFRVILDRIHQSTGYRSDVLEKDYYVTLLLKELSEKQKDGLAAYFKGGTALYKALQATNRFSEDIDLSVDTRGCSRTQNDKRLELAAKKYTSLKRDPALGRTNRSEVISVYLYNPVVSYDVNDALQRFGRVKIEATSFTISEPVTCYEIAPLLYDCATAEERAVLTDNYDVLPFPIMTITLERIFIDKLYAAEAYTRRSADTHQAFEAAKHIYDLAVLSKENSIIQLLNDEKQMERLLQIRNKEEIERLDGIYGVLPKEFVFFREVPSNEKIRRAYEIMQNQYVILPQSRIAYDDVVEALKIIESLLQKNNSWVRFELDK